MNERGQRHAGNVRGKLHLKAVNAEFPNAAGMEATPVMQRKVSSQQSLILAKHFQRLLSSRWSKMGELIVTKKKAFTHGSVSLVAVPL
jgi:hypothetical protein